MPTSTLLLLLEFGGRTSVCRNPPGMSLACTPAKQSAHRSAPTATTATHDLLIATRLARLVPVWAHPFRKRKGGKKAIFVCFVCHLVEARSRKVSTQFFCGLLQLEACSVCFQLMLLKHVFVMSIVACLCTPSEAPQQPGDCAPARTMSENSERALRSADRRLSHT